MQSDAIDLGLQLSLRETLDCLLPDSDFQVLQIAMGICKYVELADVLVSLEHNREK